MRAVPSLRLLFLALFATLALGACGGGDSGGGSGGTSGAGGSAGSGGSGGSGGSTAPVASGPYGLFEIHYVTGTAGAASYSDVGGRMNDGPPAELVVWDKKKTEGDCSLYTPRTPFCDSCVSPEVCVDTNVCRTPPTSHDVGKVTLAGLNPPSGANPLELTMVATATSTNYLCAETLPMPPCAAGSAITLDAAGKGDYPAFNIQSQCIAPLVLGTTSVTLESGKAFTLTWTPGTVADARITLEFDLSHHGGSKGQLRCDTADTGSLTVSATLLKSLLDLGVTGFPWLTVSRVVKGKSTVGSGQAQLTVYSDYRFDDMDIPGLTSCSDSSQCPSSQTCLIPSYMCGIACTSAADCPSGQTCLTTTKICG